MDSHLDRSPTRFLDHLEVDRLRLLATSVREVGPGVVVLDVACSSDATATRVADGVELAGAPIVDGSLTVRVEAVGPRTFRYRFALGAEVPEGRNPMLARCTTGRAGSAPGARSSTSRSHPSWPTWVNGRSTCSRCAVGDREVGSDWRGVARVDGEAVTLTTSRADRDVLVAGLPAAVEVRIVDRNGDLVDRTVRRS